MRIHTVSSSTELLLVRILFEPCFLFWNSWEIHSWHEDLCVLLLCVWCKRMWDRASRAVWWFWWCTHPEHKQSQWYFSFSAFGALLGTLHGHAFFTFRNVGNSSLVLLTCFKAVCVCTVCISGKTICCNKGNSLSTTNPFNSSDCNYLQVRTHQKLS